MQHEITAPIPLLDDRGELTEPGWARRPWPVYDRSRVRGGPGRCREWDSYLVGNDRFALVLTVAGSACLGIDSISLLDFRARRQVTRSPMRPFPLGPTGLPVSSEEGDVAVSGRGYGIAFLHSRSEGAGHARLLSFHMDRFWDGRAIDGSITLFDAPEESLVLCAPFSRPGQFCYRQTISGMRASGTVTLGDRVWVFRPEDSFGTLDWVRGVGPRPNAWYRASASGLVDGVPFGFHIGAGLEDSPAATENALFYGGRVHKLSRVALHLPSARGRADGLSPWTFSSGDGRFELLFRPMPVRAFRTGAGSLRPYPLRRFGRFTGRAVLDSGQVLEIRDLMGFAERAEHR